MCRGKDRVSRERPGEGAPRSRRERPAARDPAWMRGGQGRAGRAGRGLGENPLAPPDPGPTLPRPRAPTPHPAPSSAGPVPGQRSRAAPPAPPGRTTARTPPSPPRGPRGRDPRPGTPADTARGIRLRPRWEARPGGRPLASGPLARATGGGAERRDPAGGGPRARTPTSAPGFVRRMQAPSPARPRVSPGPRPGPRGGGSFSGGTPRVRGGRGRELPPLPVVPERPPPPPPYRGAAPAGPRPAPAHWLRRARSRLRGPGAAADPLCALSFPRSPSLAFVCPPPRPRAPGTRTIPAGPALAGFPVGPLGTEAGTGAGGYRAPRGEDEFRLRPLGSRDKWRSRRRPCGGKGSPGCSWAFRCLSFPRLALVPARRSVGPAV